MAKNHPLNKQEEENLLGFKRFFKREKRLGFFYFAIFNVYLKKHYRQNSPFWSRLYPPAGPDQQNRPRSDTEEPAGPTSRTCPVEPSGGVAFLAIKILMLLRRSKSLNNEEILELNTEIERTCRANRARRRQERAENMDELANPNQAQRLRDIQRPTVTANPSCIRLSEAARNYELKTFHLNMLPQFNGTATEDSLAFIRDFYGIVQTLPLNNLNEDELRTRCFPHCLKGDARQWLLNQPEGVFLTWEDVYNEFMLRFYSPQKTMDLRAKICNFVQRDPESFHEAWERFKLLLTQCPHHQVPENLLTQFFYDGLNVNCQTLVDTASGGYYGDTTAAELMKTYEKLAMNSRQKAIRGKRAGIYEINSHSDLSAQMADLTKQVKMLVDRDTSNQESCAFCGMFGHNANVCANIGSTPPNSEEANFMGAFQGRQVKNDPFSNTYNPGWHNHPNSSWRDQGANRQAPPPGFQQQRQVLPPQQQNIPDRKLSVEEMLSQFLATQDTTIKKMDAKIDQLAQSSQASIHKLELQLGQLARTVAEREQGKLPSNTENNPREVVMSISLRSETRAGDESKGRKVIEIVDDRDDKEESEHDAKQGNDLDNEVVADPSVKPYVPPIPYPQRLKKKNTSNNFQHFLNAFKKIELNIPILQALAKMPSYAKFLKELVSNKSKLEEYATVALTEECSAILQKKLPPKLKDPGSFSIPCVIGDTTISKCLCDLGASVNIMPASLYKKLGMKEMKPTTVSLQLADRSIKYPLGIVEDLFVRVGKFYFPADFLVLETEDENDISMILGRPFLATGGVLIDVVKGKLTFRMGSEKEEFNILKAMKHPLLDDSCFSIDIIDHAVSHIVEQESFKESLEACQ
ncbi:uncharacterized protein LOC126667263 [Mercurialis annua]|uniref:uncharacterized protein LOC126667263 n=1 Tax=Mercurialis annua TaxID=3986 RepID=UPI0024AD7218|nr:uncharacterized protein LOC126667263 [Mercurialis annua]